MHVRAVQTTTNVDKLIAEPKTEAISNKVD